MSNIDKRALREAAEKASTDNHTQEEWFHYLRCSTPETVLALLDELEAAEKRYAALAAENAGMDAFVDAFLSIAWQGGSADGAEIQELAIKHGLLRQETYSADEHETLVDDPGNFEDGDPVYFRVETPASDDFLAEVRAQGVEMLREHPAIKLCSLTHVCDDFAAQLRKGVI